MAKQGLNYYNVDTDRYADRKIKRLKHAFGCSGMAVYDYLLCEVYRDRGCFLVWDEDTAFDVAEYFGLKVNTVKEIVTYCGVVGLFNTELLSRGMITSEAIQKRYLEMANRARRQNIAIPEKIRLFTEELPKLTEETQEFTQVFHKVNKSKVNILKEKDTNVSLSNAQACASEEERERFLEIFTFEKNFPNPQQEVERFVAHYDATGWCRKDSTIPVKNKEALARMWKPQQAGSLYPDDIRQWLFETYYKAKTSAPSDAKHILNDIASVTMNVCSDGRHVVMICSKDAANALEKHYAFRPAWKLSYRIPN